MISGKIRVWLWLLCLNILFGCDVGYYLIFFFVEFFYISLFIVSLPLFGCLCVCCVCDDHITCVLYESK